MRNRTRAVLTTTLLATLLAAAPSGAAIGAPSFESALAALRARAFDRAMEYFTALAGREEASAEKARAAFMIGVMYEEGLGRPRDDAQARSWYGLGAEAGLASAQYNLSVLLQTGRGGPADEGAAFGWLSRAAAQGHARAQNNLAAAYFTGIGTPRDQIEAWKWQALAVDGLDGEERTAARANLVKIEATLTEDGQAAARSRAATWRETR